MKRLLPVLMGFVLLFLPSTEGWSADFQKGVDAFERGEFATALREWEPIAKTGDPTAQVNLGAMYRQERGVLQDYVRAHMWFNIAASQGKKNAIKARDLVTVE